MPPTSFFLTRSDLTALLRVFESRVRVTYVPMEASDKLEVARFSTGLDLPHLGEVTADSSIASDSFLVVPRDVEIVLRHDGQRIFVDQLANPDSIEFTPGGVHASGALIHGRVASVHKTDAAKKLLSAFRAALRSQCTTIKGFYLGSEAEQQWLGGARLVTASVASPSEYDLKPA